MVANRQYSCNLATFILARFCSGCHARIHVIMYTNPFKQKYNRIKHSINYGEVVGEARAVPAVLSEHTGSIIYNVLTAFLILKSS